MIGKTDIRLSEICEQTADQLRGVFAGQFDRTSTETDSGKKLAAPAPDPGEIAEHHGVQVATPEWLVDRQRVLVGGDRTVIVAHRLIDRRNGVQDLAFVHVVAGRAVDLQRSQ